MTVKDLKEILDACNDDAIVVIKLNHYTAFLADEQIFAAEDGESVTIDVDYIAD